MARGSDPRSSIDHLHMSAAPTPSMIDTRYDQMFPTLDAWEIERVRRFGTTHGFAPGEPLAKIGDVGGRLSVILSGEVDVTRSDSSGQRAPIEICLPVHHASDGVAELLRHLEHLQSVVAITV